jgi:hypothetical protein
VPCTQDDNITWLFDRIHVIEDWQHRKTTPQMPEFVLIQKFNHTVLHFYGIYPPFSLSHFPDPLPF